MIRADFHTHTTFSDGKNTPEEMIQAAIAKGMTAIGFSDHSYTAFDLEPCMAENAAPAYQAEIRRLQQKYAGQIRILLGIEQDFYSEPPAEGYDYIIGSVHYVRAGDAYIAVDDTPEILLAGAEKYFGGDIYALAEAYWQTVSQVVEETNCTFIGHLDLFRKFNGGGKLFDESHPRYLAAAHAAIDRLLQTGRPFEINTGAISRGYTDILYPAPPLIEYIRSRGGKFLLSSDSHRTETLCFGFGELEELASFTL